jgi:hypothetical protein
MTFMARPLNALCLLPGVFFGIQQKELSIYTKNKYNKKKTSLKFSFWKYHVVIPVGDPSDLAFKSSNQENIPMVKDNSSLLCLM